MSAASGSDGQRPRAYLPDFCAAGTVLVVVLIAELVAILLTLASGSRPGMFLVELAHKTIVKKIDDLKDKKDRTNQALQASKGNL